ncbi:uncharacterized protein LY89DRAFT_776387 [Mollisia scopiformis]|uniref:SAP domain-containing protein n=1 Tax=Mollisia scopiformis TaxID=149040 RepID=A0A194XWM2_MOLSC|nr:uncharacterized protein LY89DRAFT_776387 [Mollisia scopiformis]KUJ24700.1 hypothetical protein LY89DRAFT_776387 [Mollisia scopiformis]
MAPHIDTGDLQLPNYDRMSKAELDDALLAHGLPPNKHGLKWELVQTLVEDDKAKLPVTPVFTQLNDPLGTLEEQHNRDVLKHGLNQVTIEKAKLQYQKWLVQTTEAHIIKKAQVAWDNYNSKETTRNNRVRGYTASESQEAFLKGNIPVAAPQTAPETTQKHTELPDSAPHLISKVPLASTLLKPWLFISSKECEVRGDRIDRIRAKYTKAGNARSVRADRTGYFILFPEGEGDEKIKACYTYWGSRDNWLYGAVVHFQLFLADEGTDSSEDIASQTKSVELVGTEKIVTAMPDSRQLLDAAHNQGYEAEESSQHAAPNTNGTNEVIPSHSTKRKNNSMHDATSAIAKKSKKKDSSMEPQQPTIETPPSAPYLVLPASRTNIDREWLEKWIRRNHGSRDIRVRTDETGYKLLFKNLEAAWACYKVFQYRAFCTFPDKPLGYLQYFEEIHAGSGVANLQSDDGARGKSTIMSTIEPAADASTKPTNYIFIAKDQLPSEEGLAMSLMTKFKSHGPQSVWEDSMEYCIGWPSGKEKAVIKCYRDKGPNDYHVYKGRKIELMFRLARP